MVAQRKSTRQAFSPIDQQGKLAPNMKLIEYYFDELRAENEAVVEENRQFRTLLAEKDEIISSLQSELDRRTEERDRLNSLVDWIRGLFANKTIPAAVKMVLFHFWFCFYCMRPDQTGNEMRIGVEAASQALGCSKDTVRKATDKAEAAGLLNRRYEPITTSDGNKITLAHITLLDACSKPDEIAMEKAQGGKRQKGCRVDGTPLNAYTVRHCPTHGEISVYGQPGNQKGADHDLMIDDFLRFFKDRISSALDNDPREKQDAFEHDTQHLTTAANDLTTTAEKQDAFENSVDQAHHILPDDRQQVATEHKSINTAASCIQQHASVCHAEMPLNKAGLPAHALEKVTGYRECGSTHWQYSEEDHGMVCAECWTPMPWTPMQ